ncbi:MAG: hypothetical protein M3O46_04640 [Myxococcota bacterium]|nr:hypothetical protein [Myxococcota bacterium]
MSPADVSIRLASEDTRALHLTAIVGKTGDQTTHEVTLDRTLLARLAPDEPAEIFVRRCFDFLLQREDKESILQRFNVSDIARYFPEFEKTIARR